MTFIILYGSEPHPYDAIHDAHLHSIDHDHTHDHGHNNDHSHPHDRSHHQPSARITKQNRASDADMDKLRSTLKQFVRDWSAEVIQLPLHGYYHPAIIFE